MSAPKIEPVSGEPYCHCQQWRRYVHVPSEHAQLAENALKRARKPSTSPSGPREGVNMTPEEAA